MTTQENKTDWDALEKELTIQLDLLIIQNLQELQRSQFTMERVERICEIKAELRQWIRGSIC